MSLKKAFDIEKTRSTEAERTSNVREHSSTGFSLQAPELDVRKKAFNVENGVKTRSTEAERTSNVREHSSTGFSLQAPVKRFFPFGIYIHWPYCLTKCPYCDFFSRVKKGVEQDEVIETYLKELDFYAKLTGDRTVTSIFFGGGTPSLISPQNIEKIINHISQKWSIAPDIEISLEANPNTRTSRLFSDLRHAGINRLSLGVQALNDKDLKFFGRSHNAVQALDSIEDVLKHFDNHSADLIYARPAQQLKDWESELQQITAIGLKHLSLYQLTIEQGTVFFKKGIRPLEENAAGIMYEFTNEYLDQKNYRRYEVSNYAQPGYASRHNLLYWTGDDYLGIGESAHGRLRLNGTHHAITHPHQMEMLSPQERAEELLIMGLRLTSGINKKHFKELTGLNFDSIINQRALKTLSSQGFLEDSPETLTATPAGFLVLDYLISELGA